MYSVLSTTVYSHVVIYRVDVQCGQTSEVHWDGLPGFVTKLLFEAVQCLVQLILCHQVASVVTQLKGKRIRLEKAGQHCLNRWSIFVDLFNRILL